MNATSELASDESTDQHSLPVIEPPGIRSFLKVKPSGITPHRLSEPKDV